MSAFDSLFKKPAIPTKKRKPESPIESPDSRYKTAKIEASGKGRAAFIEEGGEEPETEEEREEFAPQREDDAEDEEGGRFFGGGVSTREKAILDFMDDEGEEGATGPEKIDAAWLRKLALNFEKRISKNAELRAKYEDEPYKFMDSEAELDADIKALGILVEHPELYAEFAKLGCLASLVGLLAHENEDISIAVVEVISELTDDDGESTPEQWNLLVNNMIDAQLLDMLAENLGRLKESKEQDRAGVYYTLSVFENLSSDQSLSERIVKDTTMMSWLLQRIQVLESPISQNKQYCGELLAILVQSSEYNRNRLVEMDGVDTFLRLLSPYRKRDPTNVEEVEMFENMFDTLSCLLEELHGKEKFIEAEGVELCLIMLRDGKMSKPRALKALDCALGGLDGRVVCEKLVESQGLKTLFGMFMKKQDAKNTESIIGLFASLLRHLPGESASRIRLLAKFMEKDYEKLGKIVSIREDYNKVDNVWCHQICSVILAWLIAEDDGARKRVTELLEKVSLAIDDIKITLNSMLEDMEEGEDETQGSREMLSTLVSCL